MITPEGIKWRGVKEGKAPRNVNIEKQAERKRSGKGVQKALRNIEAKPELRNIAEQERTVPQNGENRQQH